MTTIICYLGGTCGDLVTAMFDPTKATINGNSVQLVPEITKLKKPHLFDSDSAKDRYLLDSSQYKCIASHDTAYHMSKKHNFISIVSDDMEVNTWAATRFKNLHRPHVWEEMSRYSGARTVPEYAQLIVDYSGLVRGYTTQLITLSDIVNGNLIKTISQWIDVNDDAKNLYNQWLTGNSNV